MTSSIRKTIPKIVILYVCIMKGTSYVNNVMKKKGTAEANSERGTRFQERMRPASWVVFGIRFLAIKLLSFFENLSGCNYDNAALIT